MKTNRRQFIKASVGSTPLLAFGSLLPQFLARAASTPVSDRNDRGTALVVVQLTGGNDGLNTVVPFEDDDYHRNRPTLRLPASRVHKINDTLGFHPDMAPFQNLYEEGHLSIIQGVGYPQSSRDHEAAMRDWQTAQPNQITCETGWIGRFIDRASQTGQKDLPAVFVGDIQIPFSLRTKQAVVPSFNTLQAWQIPSMAPPTEPNNHLKALIQLSQAGPSQPGSPLLRFLHETTADAWSAAQRVSSVLQIERIPTPTDYPPFQLAQTLKQIAQLIRADLGIRIYHTELGGGGIGGFDSHANQAANHGALLRQLSQSVAAFLLDLKQDNLLGRVLLMTFSEFGRTVAENGRRGTDHGAAAPLFLAGAKFKHRLLGFHPSLKELDGGALKFHTDFRQVYATVLDQWLGFKSPSIPDQTFPPLDLLPA